MSDAPERQRGHEIGSAGIEVAGALRTARQQRRLSLRELAERLRAAGRYMSPSALSKVENGTRRLEVDELVTISEVLRVSPSRLLGYEPQSSATGPKMLDSDLVYVAIRRLERCAEKMQRFEYDDELMTHLKDTEEWMAYAQQIIEARAGGES